MAYDLSSNLSQELNSPSFLMCADSGLARFNLPKPVEVYEGTVIILTQINATLGGLLTYDAQYSTLNDIKIGVDNLHDELQTEEVTAFTANKASRENVFFSVVVSDMKIVQDTIDTFTSFPKPEGLECVNHFCLNGGSCVPDPTTCGYSCKCPSDRYVGKYCQITL